MIPLFACGAIAEYDIIAIQEPWKNPVQNTTHRPIGANFRLYYFDSNQTRVCFYVNKRIPSSICEWHATSIHLATLSINTTHAIVHIHNVYNPPQEFTAMNLEVLDQIKPRLEWSGEHMMIGDFNLHHPAWGGPQVQRMHSAAASLIHITETKGMSQMVPPGIPTRIGRESRTTLDLVFVSRYLAECMLYCRVAHEVEQASDHLPICTNLSLATPEAEERTVYKWKEMDASKAAELLSACEPQANRTVGTTAAIDEEIDQFIKACQKAVEEAVPKVVIKKARARAERTDWPIECQAAVDDVKRARRMLRADDSQEARQEYQRLINKKKAIIRKCRTKQWRKFVENLQEDKDIYSLAKRMRTGCGHSAAIIPTLEKEGLKATTNAQKEDMLRAKFFPQTENADLADISEAVYPAPVNIPNAISSRAISRLITRVPPDKAPGPDELPNRFWKGISEVAARWLQPILQACITHGYHPAHFRTAITVVIKKPNKNYTSPEAYRPIALLNTIGKIYEGYLAECIRTAAEKHALLPPNQMGARGGRSTESALYYIVQQVQTAWQQKSKSRRMASILSLDMAGAFDRVSHQRLLHNLRKRRMPEWIVACVKSFLNERQTSLRLGEWVSQSKRTTCGIPQGSVLSPILFLFFNADLLDLCQRPEFGVTACGFVDDINLIAVGRSTEETCRKLEAVHASCTQWAGTHGAAFAPTKYELIHMTNSPRRYNLEKTVQLEEVTITPKKEVNILGVRIDTGLTWKPQIASVASKTLIQMGCLASLAASTWGATVSWARRIYLQMVRPVMMYAAAIWAPAAPDKKRKGQIKKLEAIQAQALRRIAGAYRAVPVLTLEKELTIPALDVYINQTVLKASERWKGSNWKQYTEETLSRLFPTSGRGQCRPTALSRRTSWATNTLDKRIEGIKGSREGRAKRALNIYTDDKMRARWKGFQNGGGRDLPADKGEWSQRNSTLYARLTKAESSVAIQFRTEKTGLKSFLHWRRVPGVENPYCPCGNGKQTARHVILHCSEWNTEGLRNAYGSVDYGMLLNTAKGLRKLTKWVIREGVLEQFRLAKEMEEERTTKEAGERQGESRQNTDIQAGHGQRGAQAGLLTN